MGCALRPLLTGGTLTFRGIATEGSSKWAGHWLNTLGLCSSFKFSEISDLFEALGSIFRDLRSNYDFV